MKKCDVCNTIMIEDTNLHTDVVGGVSFEEQIYLTYADEENGTKPIFGGNLKLEFVLNVEKLNYM